MTPREIAFAYAADGYEWALEQAILRAIAEEREACARVAEEYADPARDLYHETDKAICNSADGIAYAIRARK